MEDEKKVRFSDADRDKPICRSRQRCWCVLHQRPVGPADKVAGFDQKQMSLVISVRRVENQPVNTEAALIRRWMEFIILSWNREQKVKLGQDESERLMLYIAG